MSIPGDKARVRPESSVSSLFMRRLARTLIGMVLVGAVLFVSAGRLAWLGGWLFLAALFTCRVANGAFLALSKPDILALRTDERPPADHWDLRVFVVMGFLVFAVLVVAGLDRRLDWVEPLPGWSRLLALAAVLAGNGLFVWAVSVNPFFSRFVKVQGEGGHWVISRGPYGFIRHPGYLGWLVIWLGLVALLGSVVALGLAWLAVPLVALRAVLEERMLMSELEGYEDYARRVPFRLIPGAW